VDGEKSSEILFTRVDCGLGREDSPYLGRKPAFTRAQFAAVRDMLGKGTTSIAQIAKAIGVKRPTVYRLKADPAAAEAALATWGM
jgi:putative DNA-invertase from lambdoid prophage Rac